jgi:hypothetical protein
MIPRKLIFGRNVPLVGLFKICSHGSEILNIFLTGAEKPQKSLIIFSITVPQMNKNSFEIYKRSFLDYASESAKV